MTMNRQNAEPTQLCAQKRSQIPAEVVRAYDIRGIVGKTLLHHHVEALGYAIGEIVKKTAHPSLIVGRDGRLSSPALFNALTKGVLAAGVNIIDIGLVTSPMLYFATHHYNIPHGVMITGSHNAADMNGLKILIEGTPWHGDDLQQLAMAADVALDPPVKPGDDKMGAKGTLKSHVETRSNEEAYFKEIKKSIALPKPLTVVIDCGNGVAGGIAPTVFEQLGCKVIPLFCEIDGNFPNHHPDPGQPKNLVTLQETVVAQKADLGLAFDGDGDRLGVVDSSGQIIWPDRLLMLLAQDLLQRHPNTPIIFDVKCSQQVPTFIKAHQGIPLMWKTGHSLIKAKMKETGALLAGELSGHLFFKERWYGFDDGIYAGARIAEILSHALETNTYPSSHELFKPLPNSVSTPEIALPVLETDKFTLIQRLVEQQNHFIGAISTIDGLRVDFEDGFGLVRASNTSANLILRFEGHTQEALLRIQDLFRQILEPVLNQKLSF